MKPGQIKIEYINPKKLKPYERNPRAISDGAMAGLKASIKQFGIVDPFVVNDKLTIIGGHQRCKAAIELGYKEVPVVFVNLPPAEEKALNVTLNNQHISGTWTPDLGDILGEIKADLPDLYLDLQLEPLELDVPEVVIESGGNSGEGGSSDKSKTMITCPQCGAELKK